jgi:hypothetical protein
VIILEKIFVKVKTDREIREEFLECFSNRAELVFCDKEISENDLKTATVIVGEPTEDELSECKNLKLLFINPFTKEGFSTWIVSTISIVII